MIPTLTVASINPIDITHTAPVVILRATVRMVISGRHFKTAMLICADPRLTLERMRVVKKGVGMPICGSLQNPMAHAHLGRFGERSEGHLETIRGHLDRMHERRRPQMPHHKQQHLENIRDKLHDVHPVLSIHEINQHSGMDHYLFESDVALTEHQAKQFADATEGGRKRAAGSATATLWDKTKPIPYTFNSTMDAERIHIVERAIQAWQNETCLRFQKDGPGENRLEFFVGGGCYSSVGRIPQWKKQPISIGDGCQMVGIAAHEIMHSLGVFHTHGRLDRDSHIIVNMASIQADRASNFIKLTAKENDNKGISYDFGSIMHYGRYYFWNGQRDPSIIPDDVRYQNSIGNRREIQFSDAKMINSIYKCSEQCTKPIRCWNSGYIDSHDCSKCKCPDFFKGRFCETSKVFTQVKQDEVKTIALPKHVDLHDRQFSTDDVNYDDYAKSVPEVIMGPSSTKLKITLVDLPTTPLRCYEACRYAGIEIVDGNFESSGTVFCCPTNKNTTFSASGNRVGIRAWAAPGITLQYTLRVEVDD